MKSEIWDKESTIKAFTIGYTLEEINQFNDECKIFLNEVIRQSNFLNGTFNDNLNDLKKANWLILNDISSSLLDCHQQIMYGNIRMASRVFRDVMENMHILELLNKSQKEKYLVKWYKNEVISHGDYRDWIKKEESLELSELTRDVYRQYPKYAHRTYRAIYESYSQENQFLNFNERLIFSNPQHLKIISKYYFHLSYFVINTSLDYADYNVLNSIQLSIIADILIGKDK
ncbi:hypothetical protein GR160_18445 [Flavobacterium sp. Sd200]|uniref:hypothetical protein n=1 Tax=Flavobacterium sp. Sd200 TaxID=2692211 RepID=UPI001367B015|nr:hypothetical protein [Flavobacterium sp. Sd200]MXN93213.1 hypothetical protein [Flavobacterium sp. Sd200]